jgi:hypothetical protein
MRDARLLIETLRLSPATNAGALATAWASADTAALVSLAEYEGAAVWLQRRLKALGIELDAAARDKLKAITRPIHAHALRVDAEANSCLARLDAAGIPVVPLKGAAVRRLAARVPYIDARGVTDVDLLVQEADGQRAWDLLRESGYRSITLVSPPDGHHLPTLVSPLGVPAELHLSTIGVVTPIEAWRRATCDGATASFDGTMRAVPSDTELLWHVMAHALVTATETAADGFRLRYWLDAAALLAAGAAIDWERFRARLDSAETERPALARAWLRAAADLGGVMLPSSVSAGAQPFDLERLLSWRLRRRRRPARDSRWRSKVLEESARGEAALPLYPANPSDSLAAHVRHVLVSCAARSWWLIRR